LMVGETTDMQEYSEMFDDEKKIRDGSNQTLFEKEIEDVMSTVKNLGITTEDTETETQSLL